MTLTKGQRVRVWNAENSGITGTVAIVSENQKSIAVMFDEPAAIRASGGGLAVTPFLPLLRDGADGAIEDLWGDQWNLEALSA